MVILPPLPLPSPCPVTNSARDMRPGSGVPHGKGHGTSGWKYYGMEMGNPLWTDTYLWKQYLSIPSKCGQWTHLQLKWMMINKAVCKEIRSLDNPVYTIIGHHKPAKGYHSGADSELLREGANLWGVPTQYFNNIFWKPLQAQHNKSKSYCINARGVLPTT